MALGNYGDRKIVALFYYNSPRQCVGLFIVHNKFPYFPFTTAPDIKE